MVRNYPTGEDSSSLSAAEPATVYGTLHNSASHFIHPIEPEGKPLRVISRDELEDSITLDEFETELREMVHRFYHPEQ